MFKKNNKKVIFNTSFLNTIDYPIIVNDELYFILKFHNTLKHIVVQCNLIDFTCKSLFYANFPITTLFYDQNHIYFSSNRNNNYEIYSYDKKDKQIYQLTNSFLNAKFPVYYNQFLYFIGETYNGYEIFRVPEKYFLKHNVSIDFNFSNIDIDLNSTLIENTENKDFLKVNQSDFFFKNYSIKEIHFYLDGILTNSNSDLSFHFSGYDPLRRHYLNFGTGLLETYTLYFFHYTYNRFLPNINIGFIKTNPFDSDKHCWNLLNQNIRSQICDIRYGFESYNISFNYPYYFRLLKSNTFIGFTHKKNRNTLSDSSAVYQYDNFSQNSLYIQFSLYYLEQYYYSISPENGFNIEFRIEHFPYKWNKIIFYNSIKPYNNHFSYTNISILTEIFIPWFIKNHVPYFSIYTNFNKGIDFQFKRNRLVVYQMGIALEDSSYGSGNIVGTFEYRFPLLYYSKRILWFLPEFGIHWISLSPFYQIGKSFEKSIYEETKIFYSKGVRSTLKLYAFYLPFYFHIIYAKGTEEQISFGFSLNINFHMQELQHLQHPEYLLPTWHYK
ncbi:MAG: hypothetical protein KatS3mg129_0666 [Leptospiraceae bacterium]|nr:MAG: hypothetical protein KatS3mg129_0666 [Leptospiraceae bacterium]